MDGYIYALCYDDKHGDRKFIYVGRTRKTRGERLKEHKRDAQRGTIKKPLYEFMRENNLIDKIYEMELGDEGEFTEDDFVVLLLEEGHQLLNAKRGDSVIPKPKQTNPINKLFREVNRKIAKEETKEYEWQNRTLIPSVKTKMKNALTKPEILAQRVNKVVPIAEYLDAAEWEEIGMVPTWGKCKEGRRLRWGDYNIYTGIKKVGEYIAYVCKNNDPKVLKIYTYHVCKDYPDIHKHIEKNWADESAWGVISSRS